MGQRFQILIESDRNLRLYHIQWLWGAYAIRRLGSFVWGLQQRIKKDKYFDADRNAEDILTWAFMNDLLDQNHFYPYLDNAVMTQEELKKEKSIKGLMDSLDNNNGQFYIKLEEKKIIGYAFYNPPKYSEAVKERQEKLMDWKEYYKDYEGELLHNKFSAKQKKEFQRGVKAFKEIGVLKKFPELKDFIDKDKESKTFEIKVLSYYTENEEGKKVYDEESIRLEFENKLKELTKDE